MSLRKVRSATRRRFLHSDGASVSVVIPMLNEMRNLPLVLDRVDRLYELVLVDGNSQDESVDVAQSLRADAKIIRQSGSGKGNALAEGVAASTGDIIVMLDADGSTDPGEIPLFVAALNNGAGFAKGSRMIQGGGSEDITGFRWLGNGVLTWVANRLFGVRYTDINYGFNAFWRDHWADLGVDYDGFEVEALMSIRAAKAQLYIVEVPSYESRRIHGLSNLNALRDGWRILKMLMRERFDRSAQTGLAKESAPAPASWRSEPLTEDDELSGTLRRALSQARFRSDETSTTNDEFGQDQVR